MNKKSEKFLHEYLNNASPTGYESSGQKLWLDYLKPFIDEWRSDNYGTAYGVINPDADFKVVIEAHADEIGWRVNFISEKGLVYVVRNGGSDHIIAPSKRVNIHTDKSGVLRGVFGWPAIHTRKAKTEKTPSIDNLFIDVGASTKDEVLEMGIDIGNPITFGDKLEILNEKYFVGRALDNRMGGFCIAEVARKLKENKIKLPFGLYIVNSVQEEIGLRGAQMISETIKPNIAIVTDVSHDTTTPMIDNKIYGEIECGKGPEITFAPSVHNKLLRLVLDSAEKNDIAIQRSASSRGTGTDTDAFAYSNGGVPSVLISLPLRYMHTTVEMAHEDDVNSVIDLIYHSLLSIDPKFSFKYL